MSEKPMAADADAEVDAPAPRSDRDVSELAPIVESLLFLSQDPVKVKDLAEATGLTPRLVQMVVGNPTAYAEYLTQYDHARHRMRQALGAQRFEDLVAGRAIRLDDGRRVAIEVAQR